MRGEELEKTTKLYENEKFFDKKFVVCKEKCTFAIE